MFFLFGENIIILILVKYFSMLRIFYIFKIILDNLNFVIYWLLFKKKLELLFIVNFYILIKYEVFK